MLINIDDVIIVFIDTGAQYSQDWGIGPITVRHLFPRFVIDVIMFSVLFDIEHSSLLHDSRREST
jgi:hypothetical protein